MAVALACCGNAFAQQASALDDYLAASQPAPRVGDDVAPVRATRLPASASQGALVIGQVRDGWVSMPPAARAA